MAPPGRPDGCAEGNALGGESNVGRHPPRRRWGTTTAAGVLLAIAIVFVAGVVLQSVMRRLGGGDVPRHLVGRPAPDFSAETLSGDTLRLSDYRGEVVLLDFWASWCLPCRMEMPNVAQVHDRYSSRGLQVIGVNLDAERSDADAAVSELGITWPQVLDGQMGSIARHYGVKSIPMTFLVGRDGTIVGVGLRGEELHSRVAEVLGAQ